MIVLAWIGIVLGSLVGLVLIVVVAAVVARLEVEGRIGAGGVAGRGRLGIVTVEADQAADLLVVRLIGLRVYRGSMADAEGEGDEEAEQVEPEDAPPNERRHRPRRSRGRLSIGSYRRLAPIVLRELRSTAQHFHVRHLRGAAIVATDDPAFTGELFGLGCAVIAWIEAAWPQADLTLDVDFTRTRPTGSAELAVSVRPVRLIPGGMRLAWSYWRERRWSRRRASGAPRAASTG